MKDELKTLQALFPKHLDIVVSLNEKTGNFKVEFQNVTASGVNKLAELVIMKAKKCCE